ncbi:MAG: serine/threonine protein phosphatase [Bacteroidales bacterium]|nr:serine/threonine protein phosphatase [Bacteroidales bacterium]
MAKRWVIPDIHGCAKTLVGLFDYMIRPSKHDRLYFLGDYIDRGPSSKEVIDFLMQLQKDDYEVRFIMGNHEDYLIKAYEEELQLKSFLGFRKANKKKKEWFAFGGKETMESFGVKKLADFPEKYIEWMRKLEYYIELDEFYLVHAGFNFRKENPFEDKNSMLWVRDYNIRPEKVRNKRIIHGHMPVSHEFIDMNIKNNKMWFIDLDNGCYMNDREGFGNLIALELNSMEYTVQYNLDF